MARCLIGARISRFLEGCEVNFLLQAPNLLRGSIHQIAGRDGGTLYAAGPAVKQRLQFLVRAVQRESEHLALTDRRPHGQPFTSTSAMALQTTQMKRNACTPLLGDSDGCRKPLGISANRNSQCMVAIDADSPLFVVDPIGLVVIDHPA